MVRKCLISLFFVFIPFSVSFASMGNVVHIFKYANQRFAMMRLIAAYKYINRFPVDITIPERVELRSLFRYVHRVGLNAASARPFIIAGVLIGKDIQLGWIKKWRAEGLPRGEKAKDLRAVILPMLVQIDRRMIDSIVLAVPTLQDPKNLDKIKQIAAKELTATYLSQKDKAIYINSLLKVRLSKRKVTA